MRKAISILLAVCMVAGAFAFAFAADTPVTSNGGTGTVPVYATVAAPTFSVTVPSGLPVTVAADGSVSVSSTAKIVNNSHGAVKCTNVAITGQNGWSQVAWDSTHQLKNLDVNTKSFALKLAGVDSRSNSSGVCTAIGVIPANDEVTLSYDAQVAPQGSDIAGTNIANVVFTISWDQ